jgi:hypothetical protein
MIGLDTIKTSPIMYAEYLSPSSAPPMLCRMVRPACSATSPGVLHLRSSQFPGPSPGCTDVGSFVVKVRAPAGCCCVSTAANALSVALLGWPPRDAAGPRQGRRLTGNTARCGSADVSSSCAGRREEASGVPRRVWRAGAIAR